LHDTAFDTPNTNQAQNAESSTTIIVNAGSADDCSSSHSTSSAGNLMVVEATGTGFPGGTGFETDSTAKGGEEASQNAHCITGQELTTGLSK